MDQRRFAERAGRAVAEGPFAAIAFIRRYIAVDVEPPVAAGRVRSRSMQDKKVPDGKIARRHLDGDCFGRVEAERVLIALIH